MGRSFLHLDERDLRTTPAMETAAPRTTTSEARVVMDTGGDIMVVCDADLLFFSLVRVVRR